jgi:hypothetical protein
MVEGHSDWRDLRVRQVERRINAELEKHQLSISGLEICGGPMYMLKEVPLRRPLHPTMKKVIAATVARHAQLLVKEGDSKCDSH